MAVLGFGRTCVLGLLLLLAVSSCRQGPLPAKIQDSLVEYEKGIDYLVANLEDSGNNQIMVIAHRGDWRNAPENSVQAIKNCIEMGVDMVEIDVQATKDGHLVLMHDDRIDRTTTGTGMVGDWTLDSLKTLYLRNGANHPTRDRVPTLEEAMLAAKGHILVNLDKCYDNFDKAYAVLEKTGTVDHVVMKGKVPLSQVKEEFGAYLDKVRFMPVVDLSDPSAAAIIGEYRTEMKPLAYEFVFSDLRSPVLRELGDIKKDGSRIWVNSLWASLNAGYDDDAALINLDSIYGWYLDKGINMIQTDRPELLLGYLRKQGLHE